MGSERDRDGEVDDAEAMRFVAALDAAMASASYPVTMVRNTMVATSRQYGLDNQFLALPNSPAKQFNVVAVMVVSQAIQVVFFTADLFAFLLALGIVAIPYDVAVSWSAERTCAVDEPPCAGTWFGIHIPIAQTIVHTSLFVAVLSGLYFTVSTSTDPLYRQRFFEPLIADVAVSRAGRDAYLDAERNGTPPRPSQPTT